MWNRKKSSETDIVLLSIDQLFETENWDDLEKLFDDHFSKQAPSEPLFLDLTLRYIEFCQRSKAELDRKALDFISERLFPILTEEHPDTVACMAVGNFLGFHWLKQMEFLSAQEILEPIYKRMNSIPNDPIKVAVALNMFDIYVVAQDENTKTRYALFRALEEVRDLNISDMWLEVINIYRRFTLSYREESNERKENLYDNLYQRIINQYAQSDFPKDRLFAFEQLLPVSELPEYQTSNMGKMGESEDNDYRVITSLSEMKKIADEGMRKITGFGDNKRECLLNETIVEAIEKRYIEPGFDEQISDYFGKEIISSMLKKPKEAKKKMSEMFGAPWFQEGLRRDERENKKFGLSLKSISVLALSAYNMGNYEESLTHYLDALELTEKQLGSNSKQYASYAYNVGRCYFNLEDFQEATEYLQTSLDIRSSIYADEDNPLIKKTRERLEEAEEKLTERINLAKRF